MERKIVLRSVFNLSFAGDVVGIRLNSEEGILLKPSEKSEVKIWCPKREIKMILLPNGRECVWEEMKNEFGF